MTDYTKAVDFAAKDSLLTGNPSKLVKGTEIDTEFNNISTAIATKADTADKLSVFAATTSAELAGVISDETGTGALVFGTSPTIATATLTSPTLSGTSGNVYSSTYTPTITNGTNITDSSASSQSFYTRVYDQVFFNIPISVNPTAIGEISLEISLPVASNFTATNQAHGMAMSTIGAVGAITGMQMAVISASIANDRLVLNGYAGDANSLQWNIIGKYRIV